MRQGGGEHAAERESGIGAYGRKGWGGGHGVLPTFLEDALSDPRERGTAVTWGSGTRVRVDWGEGAGRGPFRRSGSVVAALVVPTLCSVGVEVTRRLIP